MRKNALVLIVLSVILVAVAQVSALEPGVGSSRTADVTGGLFIEDPDRAMDVTRFSEMEGDLFHIKLHDSSVLDMGLGMNLGSFYLGAFYYGDIIDRKSTDEETTQTEEQLSGDMEVVGVTETYPGWGNQEELDLDNMNYFEAMFGFGTIGVAANVWHQSVKTTTDPITDDTIDKDADRNVVSETRESGLTEDEYTMLRPGIRVGTVLPLNSLVLRPYFGAQVGFFRDYRPGGAGLPFGSSEWTSYDRVVGAGLPSHRGKDDIDSYQSETDTVEETYTELYVFLGAVAEIDLWDVGLKYGLLTRLDNEIVDEYTNHQFDANVVNPGDTQTIDTTDKTTTEITYMHHIIQPTVQRDVVSGERFNVAMGAILDIQLISGEEEESRKAVTTTVVEDPDPLQSSTVVVTDTFEVDDTETTVFQIDPSVTAAMQYQIVPGRVRLNGSTTVRLPGYYRSEETVTPSGVDTTETVTTLGDGTVTRTFTESLGSIREATYYKETEFGRAPLDLDVSYSAGLTFDLTENLRLDTEMTATQPIDISQFFVQLVVTW